LEKFSEFERAGKTLLFVSHDLGLVVERCRRAIWLDRGRLAADGPAAETVALYRESVSEREAQRRGTAERPEPARPDRIGSGAAVVTGVRLLDRDGRPAARIRSGDPARLAMEVRAPSALPDFVFGFAISTVAGAVVFGSNTAIDGFAPEELAGDSTVSLEIASLDLAPGVYSVDAAVHADNGAPYDYRRDLLRFEVAAERSTAGVWNPDRRWSFSGGVRWKNSSRA
ncbi:MAG TPA: Wzt carbohydrate-binding domain-containing protein, partial [Thermoanaerobaculia bacterium]|nr:Wzt carbohydrate-binding domain-containing protein [Thermoanaerobaculia bacterium]